MSAQVQQSRLSRCARRAVSAVGNTLGRMYSQPLFTDVGVGRNDTAWLGAFARNFVLNRRSSCGEEAK